MFPIPWNRLFRKKDGTLVNMEDMGGSSGGSGLSYIDYPVNAGISSGGTTYKQLTNLPSGKVPVSAAYMSDKDSSEYNTYLQCTIQYTDNFGVRTWMVLIKSAATGGTVNLSGNIRVFVTDEV